MTKQMKAADLNTIDAIRVDREDFLQRLSSVEAGLAKKRELYEQSSSFVFLRGDVITYNNEVCCRRATGFGKRFKGAVKASSFLSYIERMSDDYINLEMAETELIVLGKRRRAGFVMEKDVLLGISAVEDPGEWKPLHADFADALETVVRCVGRDESFFSLCCVHLQPKFVEATDNTQIARYRIKSPLSSPALIKPDSVATIVHFMMTEIAESAAWLHFRNANGLIVSCRRYIHDYPDLSSFVNAVEGKPITLPKALQTIAARAEVAASENASDDSIVVTVMPNKIKIESKGISCWTSESCPANYNGDTLQFTISPSLLAMIAARHNECIISETSLRVQAGKLTYLVSLGRKNE